MATPTLSRPSPLGVGRAADSHEYQVNFFLLVAEGDQLSCRLLLAIVAHRGAGEYFNAFPFWIMPEKALAISSSSVGRIWAACSTTVTSTSIRS